MDFGKRKQNEGDRPLTASPHPLSHRVLLIQSEWPARALVKAELEERGFEVLGADSVQVALELSTTRGFRPELILVDTSDLSLSQADAERLAFLRGHSPLLLIRSAQYEAAMTARLAPTRELIRPLTVGEIVDAVADLLQSR